MVPRRVPCPVLLSVEFIEAIGNRQVELASKSWLEDAAIEMFWSLPADGPYS